ncbi:hypothetical protein ACFU9B_05295 [Streptomyces sp. NPDC057592]
MSAATAAPGSSAWNRTARANPRFPIGRTNSTGPASSTVTVV